MIKQEGVGVCQAGHDTPLGHHLPGLLAPATGQEDLAQEPIQPLILLRVEGRLTLFEHVPGGGHVRVDSAQLASHSQPPPLCLVVYNYLIYLYISNYGRKNPY